MFWKAQDTPTIMLEIAIFLAIFRLLFGQAMPVITITFDDQLMLRECKIGDIRANNKLWRWMQSSFLHCLLQFRLNTANTLLCLYAQYRCTSPRTCTEPLYVALLDLTDFPAYLTSHFNPRIERMSFALNRLRGVLFGAFTRAMRYLWTPGRAKERISTISTSLWYPLLRGRILVCGIRTYTTAKLTRGIAAFMLKLFTAFEAGANRVRGGHIFNPLVSGYIVNLFRRLVTKPALSASDQLAQATVIIAQMKGF